MQLTINNVTYEVDMAPLRERAAEGIKTLINDKGGVNPVFKQAVKAACGMAMGMIGLEKQHRNDDPIELVAMHVVGLIFDGVEAQGLKIAGEEIYLAPEPDRAEESAAAAAVESDATSN
jgi:hypothetical protein